MRNKRRFWLTGIALAALLATAVVLFLLFFRLAHAREFTFLYTTLEQFNQGSFYHTALSWRGDGEVQLLPVGVQHPWEPGPSIPPRGGLAAVYARGHIYAIGGDAELGDARNEVYVATVYTDVLTATERLSTWEETTPLPTAVYPDGLYHHDAVAVTFTETNKVFIYVFGGMEDDGGTSTVYSNVVFAEVLPNGNLSSWQETFPLPFPLAQMESVVLNRRIYILGGLFGSTSSEAVYVAEPDPASGQIFTWTQTLPLPDLPPGAGGYVQAAATMENGRIYIYGGSSGVVEPSYSPYVHFATVAPDGEITQWTWINDYNLPQNCYASEGSAYQSGLLLAVAGAWACGAMGCTPSGDVNAALVDHETGWAGPWVDTIAMTTPRFYHAVVQDEYGWLYSIGGASGEMQPRLGDVDIASPYGGGGGKQLGEVAIPLEHTQVTTPTHRYAPSGTYRSPQYDVRPVVQEGYHAQLTSFAWNTTISNADIMTITLSYRYYDPYAGAWTDWSAPLPSHPGFDVTSEITFPITATADYFQYRAFLSSTVDATGVATQTPLLNWVQVGVLAPPDLQTGDLTVTGCDTCPWLVPPGEPVQIQFLISNTSSGLNWNNNFYTMLFITRTMEYVPSPPALPIGCEGYDPPTTTCDLVWAFQGYEFPEGAPPMLLTVPYTFTVPGTYWLIAYADYNNTPSKPPPIYDVAEIIELNNYTSLIVEVANARIYLPLLVKGEKP